MPRMAPNWNSYHGRWWARLYSRLSDSTAATFGVASSMTLSGAPSARVNWKSQWRWP